MTEPDLIEAWHVHVYFDPAGSEAAARRVREGLEARFPEAAFGRWHRVPVGPHPQAMYQVAFAPALYARLVPWLMLNREGLDVLVHPETGREVADHTAHAAWLGNRLPLDLGKLAD